MPFDALCLYLEGKYQYECYMMDCLWSGATDFRFAESNAPKEPQKYVTKATLPRWAEVFGEQHKQAMEREEELDIFEVIDGIALEGISPA